MIQVRLLIYRKDALKRGKYSRTGTSVWRMERLWRVEPMPYSGTVVLPCVEI